MRYFSDIDEKLHENDFEWHVNQVNEGLGLLKMFKKLLASKSSLARSLFSIADKDEKEVVKKAIRDDKLKEINSGLKWWNMYFTKCHPDLAKEWISITNDGSSKANKRELRKSNRKSKRYSSLKDSYIDDIQNIIIEEYDDDEDQQHKKEYENLNDYFSNKKFEKYNTIKGMVKAIITGLCLMYDIAQEIGGAMGKERMNYVKGVFDDMLKMDFLDDIDYLKKVLKEYKLNAEEKKEDNNGADDEGKYKTLDELRNAGKKNAEDPAKIDNVDAKALGDFVSNIFSESLINSDIILNEDSEGQLDGSIVKFIEAYNKCNDETKSKIMIMVNNMFGAIAQILKKTDLEPADLSDFITAVLKHKTKADPAELVKIAKN